MICNAFPLVLIDIELKQFVNELSNGTGDGTVPATGPVPARVNQAWNCATVAYELALDAVSITLNVVHGDVAGIVGLFQTT